MIQLYSGVPGSGKSCHVSSDMLRWLKAGQYVIANFDYDARPWESRFVRVPELPKIEDVISAVRSCPRERREHNAIIVLDEASRIFNSRTWNASDRGDWVKFFTLSRHIGVDVVLIAQSPEMVDKQIRFCIQTVVRHMRLASMGMVPFIMSLFGLLPLCFWAESYYGTRVRVASGFFLPRKKFWQRYDSYSVGFLDGLGEGDESTLLSGLSVESMPEEADEEMPLLGGHDVQGVPAFSMPI